MKNWAGESAATPSPAFPVSLEDVAGVAGADVAVIACKRSGAPPVVEETNRRG